MNEDCAETIGLSLLLHREIFSQITPGEKTARQLPQRTAETGFSLALKFYFIFILIFFLEYTQ
jgi:hypothetical protein